MTPCCDKVKSSGDRFENNHIKFNLKKIEIMVQFIKAVLGLSTSTPADKVVKSQNIKDSMQTSGNFLASSMPITYVMLQSLITNLHNAVVAATNGTPANTAYMHEQERMLVVAFNLVKAHVEMVANNSGANAASIITSAGMQVAAGGGTSALTELSVTALGNGKVQVRVPRQTGEKAFVFESSTDNATWVEFASSTETKVTLPNQTPGSTLYVRYYAINKTGKSPYSQSKNTIVL